VVGEESPFYRVSSDDPDFEETDLLESDPPLDPPDSSGAEVATADEERSLSRSLIGLVKTLLGGASAEPQPPAAVAKHPAQGAPSPTVFPADRGPDSDSFDSVTDEETTRKVQEALARMERGEKPFDD